MNHMRYLSIEYCNHIKSLDCTATYPNYGIFNSNDKEPNPKPEPRLKKFFEYRFHKIFFHFNDVSCTHV